MSHKYYFKNKNIKLNIMVFKNMVNIMLIYFISLILPNFFQNQQTRLPHEISVPAAAGPFILELQITLQPDKLLTSLLLPKNHT